MAASRDKWLIGMVGVTAIGVAATIGYLVTEGNRAAAVSKLRAKTAAALDPHVAQSLVSGTSPNGKAAPVQPSIEMPDAGPSEEESIARFEDVFKKRRVMQADPSWEEVEEIVAKKTSEWTDADREKIKEYLSACSDVIRELRELARSGGPVYELDFSKGFAMELPHLAQLRDCARLLAADAVMQADRGEYGEAVQDLLATMKLADALDKEPILISQLVRITMDGIVYETVSASIPGEELPPEAARELIEYASRAGQREAFANSFNGEGFFGLGAFEEIRSGNINQVIYSSSDPWNGFLMRIYGSPVARPWLNMDEEAYADIIGRIGEAAALPYYEAKPVFDQIDADIQGLPRTRVMSRMVLPALTRAAEAQARHEAYLGLMSLGLAIEQYHAQNGEYPATLNGVAPTLGGSIPLDPFTGQPFGYESSGDSYSLYSAMGSALSLNEHLRRNLGIDERGNLVWRRAPQP
ncbi:MAG TPA: hypothetical protein VMZ06_08295 [Candidatus Bathyarchaeia archaeon]|nr:hypothetical protein [Candidatus Bathyarchaeia archaeon]